MSTLDTVRSQGFDRTSVVRGSRPRSYRPACSACEVLVICGVACHETGCPRSHIDPETGEPYAVECQWCGQSFTPEERWQRVCDDECAASYYA